MSRNKTSRAVQHRAVWLVVVLAVCLAPTVILHAQAPIIQPGDISTPTPTPLFPTATPAPDPAVVRQLTGLTADDTPRTYTVRPGDTLFSVALETGLDLDDVPCAIAPDFTADQPLVIGNVLAIPPANVVCHTVQAGETLASIAPLYGATAAQINLLAWNNLANAPLADTVLPPGTHLRVPLPLPEAWSSALFSGGKTQTASDFLPTMLSLPVNTSPFTVFSDKGANKTRGSSKVGPVPADWPYGSGHFTWPVYGWLSQSYRYDHRAIDIAAVQGTPVTAADRGVVVRAGWNDQGYGNFVVVDHKIDYVTLYGHLDRILVHEGDVVGQGQVLGTVGSTGNSTGPHLHFELRDFGRLTNPLELLAGN